MIVGAQVERFYDIERAWLTGGSGANLIDATAFVGQVTLVGGSGNDTLLGTSFADSLVGGTGDDSLLGFDGGDVLDTGAGADYAAGGAGDDLYLVDLDGFQTLSETAGIDSIDLSGAAFAVTADLGLGSIKFTHLSTNIATLVGEFENLRGTNYDDLIRGSAGRNILEGGGGIDRIDGGDDADTLQASFPQIIWLDFETGTGSDEHFYTIDERNKIQERLEKAFTAPFSISFSQTPPSVGRFSRVTFNAGESEALVAGAVDELDWRNSRANSQAYVNVNGFLGRRGQPAASSENYIGLSANIAIHEIGHTLGLRHTDAFGPIGSGIFAPAAIRTATEQTIEATQTSTQAALFVLRSPVLVEPSGLAPFVAPSGTALVGGAAVATFQYANGDFTVTQIGTPLFPVMDVTLDPASGALLVIWNERPAGTPSIRVTYQYDAFRPGWRGADDAFETPRSYLASPASMGTTVADTLLADSFGARGLIKIAFADTSSSVRETDLGPAAPPPGYATARSLPFAPLAVPNLLPVGYVQHGQQLQVRAANVLGALAAGTADVYAFTGRAGDVLAAELFSFNIPSRIADPIDGVLRVYDNTGTLLAWNDDALGGAEPILFDVPLPYDGTYFIAVSAFSAADAGGYELFTYTASPASADRLGGAGDTLTGGAGPDVLIGGAGDDTYDGDPLEDTFIGFTPDIDGEPVPNFAPTATVTLAPDPARTNNLLVATVDATDPEDDDLTFTYEWRVNGTVVGGAIGSTLDLAQIGERGDEIEVFVTASDGFNPAVPAEAKIVVANSPPMAEDAAFEMDEDAADPFLGAVLVDDADLADDHTFELVAAPANGTFTLNPDGSFEYVPPANFHGTVTFTFVANDGEADSNVGTATILVLPDNDAPTIAADAGSLAILEGMTATNAGSFADPDGDLVTLAASIGTVIDLGGGRWSWSWIAADGPADSRIVSVTATDPLGRETTASFDLVVGNAAPTAEFDAADAIYGQTAIATFTSMDDASAIDKAAGFRYQFSLSAADLSLAAIGTNPVAQFTGLAAGGYTVYARILDKDGGATDYSATFTVSKANAAVIVTGHTGAYDGQAHGLTGAAVGALGEDLATLLDLGASRTRAGTTDIEWSFAGDDNHFPASGTAAISITPAALTVAANHATRVYGTTNPNFTASYDGFVPGEDESDLTGTLAFAAPGTDANVGEYAITPSGLASTDYAITFIDGTLAITQASLTFTVNDATRVEGTANPTFTGAFSGLVNGDSIGVSFSTVATTTSGPGVYSITASLSGLSLANYTATVVPGTLTITPAAGGPVQFTGGNLSIAGSAGADTIHLAATGGGVLVQFNGTSYGPFAVTGSIVVQGGDGADAITVADDVNRPVTLIGGAGNDTLRGGSGADLLEGGLGDDSLVATAGNDTLAGGDGNDTLKAGSGNDLLFGGDGDDSLQAASGNDTLTGGAGHDTLRAGSGDDSLLGGAGNDSLVGHSGNDRLDGESGDDTIRAGSGNDIVFGGDGHDSIIGASGCDVLDGGAGNDTIRAGSGVDVVFGGDGHDSLLGGSGLDTLDGGAGNDTILAGSGVDFLAGGDGHDSLFGGAGRDTLLGNAGDDTLFGGGGDDFLDGGAGHDRLDGDGGSDILLGGDGNDVLVGGSGNDFLIGGFGSDHLFGNAAEDILVAGYTAHDSDVATLNAIMTTWNGSTSYQSRVSALSNVLKSGTNATVFDDAAADQLTGNAGSDWFFANITGWGVQDCITDLGSKDTTSDT